MHPLWFANNQSVNDSNRFRHTGMKTSGQLESPDVSLARRPDALAPITHRRARGDAGRRAHRRGPRSAALSPPRRVPCDEPAPPRAPPGCSGADEQRRGDGHIAQIPRVNNGFARPQSSLLVNLNAIGPAPTVTGWQPADQEGVRSLRTRNPESVPAQHPESAATVRKISGLRPASPSLSTCKSFGHGTNGAFPTGGALAGSRTPILRIHKETKSC